MDKHGLLVVFLALRWKLSTFQPVRRFFLRIFLLLVFRLYIELVSSVQQWSLLFIDIPSYLNYDKSLLKCLKVANKLKKAKQKKTMTGNLYLKLITNFWKFKFNWSNSDKTIEGRFPTMVIILNHCSSFLKSLKFLFSPTM